jgi:hypothetical protein
MKTIETEITINANVETVWRVLTDFQNHPKWNPFIKSITGEKTVGQTITVSIKPPNGNGMTFKPKILKFDQNKEFRWLGKLGFTGIFDGEHYFILEQISDKQTKFIHGEKFSGILVMISGKMLDKTKDGFELMNQAIKKICEK